MRLSFTWILPLLVSISSSEANQQIQGCSLVGLELQHCLYPSTITPLISLDSCCTTLNQAAQAGFYCLCSLLGPRNDPFLSSTLALSLSNCYLSVPSLTECHVLEPTPHVVAPPVALVPVLNQPSPAPVLPVQMPRNDLFVPLPPKVEEIPLNLTSGNASIVEREGTSDSNSLPMMSFPENWEQMTSDDGNDEMLLYSRILLIAAFYAYFT